MTRLFPLRQCSDEELKRRTRPCLLYSIKRCIAPCVGKCTKEEYHAFVDGAAKFLRGHDKEILKKMREEMEKASENLEFEKAAALLMTIKQIQHVLEAQHLVARAGGKDCDALAIFRQADEVILMQLLFREGNLIGSEHYSFSKVIQDDVELLESFLLQHYKDKPHLPQEILLPISHPGSAVLSEILKTHVFTPQKGEKKALVDLALQNAEATFQQEKNHQELREKMLLDLQETLKLNRYPKRIECFDTSNTSGSELVACMVTFTDGLYDKKRTRLFRIRDINKGDDYGAMHQALSRRLIRAKEEEDLPDLILVDGGKGQLNVALDVFKELDIATVDVLAVAKQEGRHDRGMTKERVFLPHQSDPIVFDQRSPLLFLIQTMRDEAHRKAITFQRQRRAKKSLSSGLDTLPGIGKVKKARLLRHFGSLKRVKSATEEELRKVKGINKNDIKRLLSPNEDSSS